MRLYLVRHGDAVSSDLDPARPLSAAGRAEAARMARFLAEAGVRVPLARLLEEAIGHGERGIPVTRSQHEMTAAKLGELVDQPGFADSFLVDGAPPAVGCVFRQSEMGSIAVVVVGISAKQLSEMSCIQDNYVIQKIASDRPDDTLNVSVLPWRSWRYRTIADTHPLSRRRYEEPYEASRSRRRYSGPSSHGNASTIWRAIHSDVG